jgi:hypothetical protein
MALVCSLAPGVLGVVLLAYADRLSAWLGYGTEPMAIATKTSLGGRELQAIGFSFVGILLLIRASGQLTGMLSSLLMVFSPPRGLSGQLGQLITSSLLGAFSLVLQLGLGVGLFFGGRSLADWWHDRYAPPEEVEGEAVQ